MKKLIWLGVSIFSFIINFVCCWYSDTLFDRFFVFGLIPQFFSILTFIVALVASIVLIIKNKKTKTYYFSLIISVLTVITIFVFPFRMAKVQFELKMFEKDRLEIIEMVKKGSVKPNDNGHAELPDGYGHTSSEGNILVYQNDEEQVISFWVFRGLLSGSFELIYSSSDESLIYANESPYHPIANIEKLKEHWYLVKTDH